MYDFCVYATTFFKTYMLCAQFKINVFDVFSSKKVSSYFSICKYFSEPIYIFCITVPFLWINKNNVQIKL